MRRVGEPECIGSKRESHPFCHFEVTQQALVHVEESRTTERIAIGVWVMSIRAIRKDQWSGKYARVEVMTAQVVVCASKASAWRLALKKTEIAHQVGGLAGTVCIQGAAGAYGEGRTGHPTDDRIDDPAAENPFGSSVLCPSLPLAEGKGE